MGYRINDTAAVSIHRRTGALLLSSVIVAKLIIWVSCGIGSHNWSWISAFHKWDSYWYERIALHGYHDAIADQDGPSQSSFAFFPCYPMLTYVVSCVFHISVPRAMEVLSYPITLLCLWGAWKMFLMHGSVPKRGILTFLLWPFSLFLFVHYSDALFITLVLWSLVALDRKQDVYASICLALLAITRPNGIFFLPVFALLIFERETRMHEKTFFDTSVLQRIFAVLIGPIVTFSAWCAIQWRIAGNPFAFSAAQAGWGRKLSWPWEGFFASGDFATQFESWYTLALLFATAWYWRRMAWSYRLWLVLGILGPLLSGSVDSMTRFSLSLFPLILLVGSDMEQAKRPYLTYALFIGIQVFCLSLWALYHPLMA